ncbi:MAG: ADP-ribosylation factor-like protein, partial [Candidatus Odinarchaeia archaeon]
GVYIIKKTGESLFHRLYQKETTDENLISGFLSALQNFISEVSSGDVIRTIKTGNVKFIYNVSHGLISVFVVDKDEDEEKIRNKIERVIEEFYSRFKDQLNNWSGNISQFNSFKEVLDDIVSDSVKVSLIGFGGVGKTTLMKLLKGEEIPLKHNPTIAVNIKPFGEVKIPGFKLVMWDFAGQERFESLWRTLIKGSDIIIVVVDSTMINVLKTRRKIMKLINEYNPNAKVLVFANKQDLPRAIRPHIISDILKAETHGIVAIDPSFRKPVMEILAKEINKWVKLKNN